MADDDEEEEKLFLLAVASESSVEQDFSSSVRQLSSLDAREMSCRSLLARAAGLFLSFWFFLYEASSFF